MSVCLNSLLSGDSSLKFLKYLEINLRVEENEETLTCLSCHTIMKIKNFFLHKIIFTCKPYATHDL